VSDGQVNEDQRYFHGDWLGAGEHLGIREEDSLEAVMAAYWDRLRAPYRSDSLLASGSEDATAPSSAAGAMDAATSVASSVAASAGVVPFTRPVMPTIPALLMRPQILPDASVAIPATALTQTNILTHTDRTTGIRMAAPVRLIPASSQLAAKFRAGGAVQPSSAGANLLSAGGMARSSAGLSGLGALTTQQWLTYGLGGAAVLGLGYFLLKGGKKRGPRTPVNRTTRTEYTPAV
jgi:hypothetical protein